MESLSAIDRLERIASHYNRRPAISRSIASLRIPCPVHQGTDDNLAFWVDQGKDRIAAKCHSNNCDYSEIAKEIESTVGIRLGPARDVQRTFRYPDGKRVFRTDYAAGGKDIKQDTGATADGAPLYVVQPDGAPLDPRVIVVEGESTAQQLGKLGYWAATWRGGAQAAGKSDHSALQNRAVILWPDDDELGRAAMSRIAQALTNVALMVQYAGLSHFTGNSKADASDYEPDDIAQIVEMATDVCPWESAGSDGGWHLGLFFKHWTDIELPVDNTPLSAPYIQPGKAEVLFGPPGGGKSLFTLFRAIDVAMSGRRVCWVDTEEGEGSWVERVTNIAKGDPLIYDQLKSEALYYAHLERLLSQEPRFAQDLIAHSPDFVVIDTGFNASGGVTDEKLSSDFWMAVSMSVPRHTATWVITHPPKSGGNTPLGSQLWTARPRGIYQADGDRWTHSLLLTITDAKLHRVPQKTYEYLFRENGAIEERDVTGEKTVDAALARMTMAQRIRAFLYNGAMDRDALWAEIEASDEDVKQGSFRTTLSRMRKRGEVVDIGANDIGLRQLD